jgi:hypothetical protein
MPRFRAHVLGSLILVSGVIALTLPRPAEVPEPGQATAD